MKYKYYVTMTDEFLSGWGFAENKISKFIICCDTYEQAKTTKRNALKRGDMKSVRICTNRPQFAEDRYHSEYVEYCKLGSCWKEID